MKVIVTLLISSLLLSACFAPKTRQIKIEDEQVEQERQKQQQLALVNLQKLNTRLADNAYPLVVAASSFCEDKENQTAAIGLSARTEFAYKESFRETAKALFNLDENLRVTHIIADGPAAAAGIQKNDRLISVNNKTIPTGETAAKEFRTYLSEIDSETFPVRIERGGTEQTLQVTAPTACNYRILLSESDAVNAYATGDSVVITKGMMRFAETEQELSLVVAHEIAHNAMSHVRAKTLNTLGGTLLDIAAGAAGVNTQGMFGKMASLAYSQEFEREADYVGLYIMAQAGVSTENAAMFWRRMAVEHPASINSSHTSTHPATAERFIAIEKTLQQIEEKKQDGTALMPDMKE